MMGHIETIHEGKKQFKCDICYVKFSKKGNLKKHVTIVHEVMKERSDSNVTIVMPNLNQNRKLIGMLQQFMMEGNHSNVNFVMLCFLGKKGKLKKHVATLHEGKKQSKI